jgi:hypothetical protein
MCTSRGNRPAQTARPTGCLAPPSGPFNLTTRVYQPKQAMLHGHTENNLVVQAGTYQIPPIQKMSR